MVNKKKVTPKMKVSFLRMIKNYYNCSEKEANIKYKNYLHKTTAQRKQIRPYIIDAWKQKYGESPPYDEEEEQIEEQEEELERKQPKKQKWNKYIGFKISENRFLNPAYVEQQKEKGNRIISIDKEGKSFFDVEENKIITRHGKLLYQGKRKGSYENYLNNRPEIELSG